MKKLFITGLILLIFSSPIFAAELFHVWTDFWNNGAYYGTNFENSSFSTYVLRSDGKVGVNLIKLWGDTYFAPYVVYSTAYSQDVNYWNNNLYSGIGVRVKPFAQSTDPTPMNELKIFYESLSASYYKDGAAAVAAGRPAIESKYGLDLYYEWNQPKVSGDENVKFSAPWAEVWTNLAFLQTNFYQTNFNSYLFRLQPKYGLYLGGNRDVPPRFEPYLTVDFVASGRNYSWLNRAAYGIGVRTQPFRYIDDDVSSWMFKFKMFAEILGVAYFRTQPTTLISSDYRLGVDFTIGR